MATIRISPPIVGEDVKQFELSNIAWECKRVLSLWKSLAVSYKVIYTFPYDPAIQLLVMYIFPREGKTRLQKDWYVNICSSFGLPGIGNHTYFHQQENGQTGCTIFIQWNTTQQQQKTQVLIYKTKWMHF